MEKKSEIDGLEEMKFIDLLLFDMSNDQLYKQTNSVIVKCSQ